MSGGATAFVGSVPTRPLLDVSDKPKCFHCGARFLSTSSYRVRSNDGSKWVEITCDRCGCLTPAKVAPQKGQRKRPDASKTRENGAHAVNPVGASPKPAKHALSEIPCKREGCKRLFTPKRPDQAYCNGSCRRTAYIERKIDHDDKPLLVVLQELASRPARLRELITKHKIALTDLLDPMQKFAFTAYTDFCELARRAEYVLEERKKKK